MALKLSVVIVNYKVRELLSQTLRSLREAEGYNWTEVIVVDNDSQDGSAEMIAAHFPEVEWIGLKRNVGFGKGCNIGAAGARGEFLLMLNPDTIVSSDTLTKGVAFFANHAKAGLVGPKVLNQDGSFQWQCRRSFPTPVNALAYMLGLHRLFPQNRNFGAYAMTWAEEGKEMVVDAVSGSCFFIPTALYNEIGGFDEAFFMYGEDLDICAQVAARGYEVWYSPITEIIHFKGKSSAQKLLATRIAFYKAMLIFSNKHRQSYGSFFPRWFIALGIWFQGFLNLSILAVKQLPLVLLDVAIVNSILPLVVILRYTLVDRTHPYSDSPELIAIIHLLATVAFLAPFWATGQVLGGGTSKRKTLLTGAVSLMLFFSVLFAVHDISFSRIAFSISGILTALTLSGWRIILPQISGYVRRLLAKQERVLILGEGEPAERLITELIAQGDEIDGVIWGGRGEAPVTLGGFPVFGTIDEMVEVVKERKSNVLLIASESSWYSRVITGLSSGRLRGVVIKWLPMPLSGSKLPPLQEFSL